MTRHTDLWPARISAFHDSHWLQMRRVECGSRSILAGPTCIGAMRAKVERRWHDGLQFANTFIANDRLRRVAGFHIRSEQCERFLLIELALLHVS